MSKELNRSFTPPWWLRNRHFQSCYSTLFPPTAKTLIRWEQLELPDGDFIDLCWSGPSEAPLVVLLHGLEGSVNSHYIQLMLDALVDGGWQVVVMHFRTCSGRMNRLPRSYHAGETGDLTYLLHVLKDRFPHKSISAVGFSLGGNVLLRYLVENPISPLRCVVAISVPFELNKCSDYLAYLYHWTLLKSMKQKTIDKIKQGYDMPVTISEVKSVDNFRGFDEKITAPLHGFKSADDYYTRVSVRPYLKLIDSPTLIIHALDDPLVPADSVPTQDELSEKIYFELTRNGGHVGFIQGAFPWIPRYWLKQRILDFLNKKVRKT